LGNVNRGENPEYNQWKRDRWVGGNAGIGVKAAVSGRGKWLAAAGQKNHARGKGGEGRKRTFRAKLQRASVYSNVGGEKGGEKGDNMFLMWARETRQENGVRKRRRSYEKEESKKKKKKKKKKTKTTTTEE